MAKKLNSDLSVARSSDKRNVCAYSNINLIVNCRQCMLRVAEFFETFSYQAALRLEKSPTLGSIESSDFEKRTFAVRSLEYNLRIPQFIELFPELAEQLKNKLEERKKVLNRLDNDSSESDSHVLRNEDGFLALNSVNGDHENMNEQNRFYSFFMNIFIFLGFAIFAFAVKYVILNIS